MTTPLITSTSQPDYCSPAYLEMKKRWDFVRAIRGGTETLWQNAGTLLPRFEAEALKNWTTRVGMTFAYDALDETIHAMVGLVFRKDPELGEDVPPRLVAEWEDLDGQGTHGAILAQKALDAAIQDGHCALLVDHPPAPKGLSLAQEQALGLRANVVLVTADQITAWRIGKLNGTRCLMMVKLAETVEVPDGAYGSRTVKRYRTLYQRTRPDGTPFVSYQVHEEQSGTGKSGYALVEEGELRGPTRIPLFPVYGGEQVDILRSYPPLRGLAYSNLDHTQVKSDRRYSMHKCAIPVPVFIGRSRTGTGGKGEEVVLSANDGVDVGVGGDAKYMEPTGAALSALREELQDIERRMGSQGFSMIRRDTAAPQTATEKVIDEAKDQSKLARAARSVQDALEGALKAMAAFYGLEVGGSVEVCRDFADTFLTEGEMRLLSDLESEGKLSLPTLLKELQKGGRVLQGVDVVQEAEAVRRTQATEPMGLPGAATPPPASGLDLPAAA